MLPLKMRSRKTMFAIASICMCAGTTAVSQELDLAELFNLDIEVTVASKKAESLSDAPGMIVAYSENDIRNLGQYSINDLANQTTGYSSYYIYGERVLESRGQKAGSFNNNKHLLLIDGIPVHNARNYKAPIEEVSLLGAQRVEFLKGPGSALYGTGAFYGVVSVIPKTLPENGSWSSAMLTLSSEDFSKRVQAASVVRTDAGMFSLTASYFDKDASMTNTMTIVPDSTFIIDNTSGDTPDTTVVTSHEFDGFTGGDTTDIDQLDYDDQNSQFVNMSYKLIDGGLEGLGFGFIYTRKSGGLGEFWGGKSHIANNLLWETAIPYIKYQRDFTDNFSFNSYLKGNYSVENGHFNGIGSYRSQVADVEVLTEGSWDFGDGGALIAGLNYDLRKELSKGGYFNGSHGTNILEVSYWNPSLLFHTVSAYAQYQIEFDVLSGLKLTAGLRSDNGISNEGSGATNPTTGEALDREGNSFTKVSPRAGIVQKFSDVINAKLLYGTALRSPGIKEFGLIEESRNTITAIGSNVTLEDVGAEVINTFEGSVNFSFPQFKATVGGYYNITTDALDGYSITVQDSTQKDTTLNVFGNSDNDIKGGGIEVDIQAMPIQEIKIMIGGSYGKSTAVVDSSYTKIEGTDTTTVITQVDHQVYGVPTGKINAAVSYNHSGAFKFAVTPSLRYYLGYRLNGDSNLSDGDLKDKNGITDGYAVLDLNLRLPVNEHLGFEVLGKNLTNTEFYQPGGNGIASVNPKIKGPSVALSLVGQF